METKNRSNTGDKALIVHARDCYKLMTNPRNKGDELSETTKSWLKEMAIEDVLGLRKIIDAKPMIKGVLCVDESIDLYNTVMESNFIKNRITIENHGFRGQARFAGRAMRNENRYIVGCIYLSFFRDEVSKQIKKGGYDWQCRVYMMLFGVSMARVSYCLVDTPTVTPNGEPLLHKWDDKLLHTFDGIVDSRKRVSTSQIIERDFSIEQQIRERYAVANRYYQMYLAELYYK